MSTKKAPGRADLSTRCMKSDILWMIGSAEERNGGRLYETEKTPDAVVLYKTDVRRLQTETIRDEELIPVDMTHPP